jgi:hypothetical protein
MNRFKSSGLSKLKSSSGKSTTGALKSSLIFFLISSFFCSCVLFYPFIGESRSSIVSPFISFSRVESLKDSFKGRLRLLSGDKLPFEDILLIVCYALVGLNSSYSKSNSSTSSIKLAEELCLFSLEPSGLLLSFVYLF